MIFRSALPVLAPLVVLAVLVVLSFLPVPLVAEEGTAPEPRMEEIAVLETNYGTMAFRFYAEAAPKTTAQIKKLIRDGFYDGKHFYRVVSGHVIQAGDVDGGSAPTVPGEFGAAPHTVGAVGLARDEDPDSGTTEIYICLAPRSHLDDRYAVFGQLVEGLDVLAKIGAVEVEEKYVGPDDAVAFHEPKEPVVIERATLKTRVVEKP